MPFKLNVNQGVNTLHLEHPWEVCQTDDAEGMKEVDDETAAALASMSNARLCKHCFKDGVFDG
jgi:hypothetical protein